MSDNVKTRIDILLVNKGLVKSREKAKALIKKGAVSVDGIPVKKVSDTYDEDSEIVIASLDDEYVSRGAYKLKHAIDEFGIDLNGRTCIDIGASTGGFTQVMLNAGAKCVYAIDVGHDQLDDMLKTDERVISLEGINFRYMKSSDIGERIDFAAADLSFISLEHILKNAYDMLSESAEMVALIKPQFEAGKSNIGKHGIVKDTHVHRDVINKIFELCSEIGFLIAGLTKSPIKGGSGNTEYLVYITKDGARENNQCKGSTCKDDACKDSTYNDEAYNDSPYKNSIYKNAKIDINAVISG